MRLSRRAIISSLFILSAVFSLNMQAAGEQVTVYKLASCGCCKMWVQHLRQNGFQVITHDVPSTAPYRQKYGIPDSLQSCHTAVVGKYAIEGHVPASDIKQLLKDRVVGKGLAVPGMPLGSPGMEAAKPSQRDAFSVVLVAPSGQGSVYRIYTATE